MHNILIAGAGKIGSTIARILAESGDYRVYLVDNDLSHAHPNAHDHSLNNLTLHEFDVSNRKRTKQFIQENKTDAILSCLPYTVTIAIAKTAKDVGIHYFDLTEDTHATEIVDELAHNAEQAFAPQCGLAPGFIDIVANDLIQRFESLEEVKLRCGALPQSTSNALQYALNWSTMGLINEYGNPCDALINHQPVTVSPLEDLEELQIDGANYEAFNTSGGIGSLINTYKDRVANMTYKTIRYPGHRDKMHFLMQGLKLNQDRDTLKRILESAIPTVQDDVVIVYVSANGTRNGQLTRDSYVKKFYPKTIAGVNCTAIQATTACGASAVIDIILNDPANYHGHIKHSDIRLDELMANRFGTYFAEE